jgi:mRNA cleavage and polyadenylation factor CLP1 P-loop
MKELAQTLEKLFNGNAESRAAGMVINTMGWVEGLGYKVLLYGSPMPRIYCSSESVIITVIITYPGH